MGKRTDNKRADVEELKILKAKEKEIKNEVKEIKEETKLLKKEVQNEIAETEILKEDKESLLKAINETDAEIEEIRTEEKSYNLFISHNKVLVVPKITKADIKDGGKLSEGYDYDNDIKVKILDKDYGKSAELMRALLEKDSKRPLWLLLLMIVGGIGATIGFIMILVSIFDQGTVDNIKKDILPINSTVTKEEIAKTDVGGGSFNTLEEVGPITINRHNDGLPGDNNIMQNTNEDIRITDLKNSYEIEKLNIEVLRLIDEKNILTHENFVLKGDLEQKEIIIENLKEKLQNYSDKGENLSLENFKSYLGKMVYDGCQKREKQGLENNCKDLYFKFVKNVNGLNQ